MRRVARVSVTVVVFGALFIAGTAAGGVNLKRLILKPGQCITVAKVSVCAAKTRRPKARTVTKRVTSTITAAPITVTAPPRTITAPSVTVTGPPVTVTAPPVTVTTTPTPQIAFRDGTYRVGTDIVPGTYRSTATSSGCYWERLSGFGGTLDEIIANYFGIGPTYVTIASTDLGFRSDECGGWTKVS